MAYSREQRDAVRRAYIIDQLSIELAAMRAGVSESTVQRWKRDAAAAGDNWDSLRAAHMLAGGGMESVAREMLMALIIQIKAVVDLVTTEDISALEKSKAITSMTDALSKAIAASKRLLPETSELATALETIQLLTEFARERMPQHLPVVLELIEPFGETLAAHYG